MAQIAFNASQDLEVALKHTYYLVGALSTVAVSTGMLGRFKSQALEKGFIFPAYDDDGRQPKERKPRG